MPGIILCWRSKLNHFAGCGDILDEAGENDTLVVETDNLDGLEGYNKMDTFGHPFTDQMRIGERIRRVAPDTLRIDFTFDDPGAYTKTWGGTKLFKLKPDWEITHDFVCEDHLKENFLRDMKSGNYQGRP